MNDKIMPVSVEDMIRNRYAERYDKYGYSRESLGWSKDKQNIRFHALTSNFDCLGGISLLDIGCGFGDIIKYFQLVNTSISSYFGIDLVPEFIQKAKDVYKDKIQISFESGNFLDMDIKCNYDYGISSGIFNHSNYGIDMYAFIEATMKKAFDCCNIAIAMDFLSYYVNYKNEENFYSKPEKILEIAYGLSKNVILKNDYFPFEFCIIIYKDETYHPQNTYFNTFRKKYENMFVNGVFSE